MSESRLLGLAGGEGPSTVEKDELGRLLPTREEGDDTETGRLYGVAERDQNQPPPPPPATGEAMAMAVC